MGAAPYEYGLTISPTNPNLKAYPTKFNEKEAVTAMRFYKSKTFLIMLTVAISLVAVPAVLSFMGITAPLKNVAATVATPFQWCAGKLSGAARGFVAYFTEFDDLRRENESLRAELNEVRDQLHRAELAEEENAFLRDFLDLPETESILSLLDAQIIARGAGNAAHVYTLNRGSIHGVAINMPVITADGLVGAVSEVGINWCRVTSILEINASAGAADERSGAVGLCEGTYELREAGLCRLTYLPEGSDVAIGDRIVTSGYGSVYPQGIAIGTVTEIRSDDYARQKIALIEPAVDFERLARVMIVTDCVITPIETVEPEDPTAIIPSQTEGGESVVG